MSINWRDQNPTEGERQREEERRDSTALRSERSERNSRWAEIIAAVRYSQLSPADKAAQDKREHEARDAQLAAMERESQAIAAMRAAPDDWSDQESDGHRRRRESIRKAYEEFAAERNTR